MYLYRGVILERSSELYVVIWLCFFLSFWLCRCALTKCLREQNPLSEHLQTGREEERNLDDLKRWVLFQEERKRLQRETEKHRDSSSRFEKDLALSSSSSPRRHGDTNFSFASLSSGSRHTPPPTSSSSSSSELLLGIKRETSALDLSLDGEISKEKEQKTSFLSEEKNDGYQTERERSRLCSVSHEPGRHQRLESESSLLSPRLFSRQRKERNDEGKARDRDSEDEEAREARRGGEEERDERSSMEGGEDAAEEGMRERGFLTISEQELLKQKKRADPTKARRIFLAIFRRERKRMKRREGEERKSKKRNLSLRG